MLRYIHCTWHTNRPPHTHTHNPVLFCNTTTAPLPLVCYCRFVLLCPATDYVTGFWVSLGGWWKPMLDPANRRKGVLVRGTHRAEETRLKVNAFARIWEEWLGLYCSTLDELIMKSRSWGNTSILSLRSRSGKEAFETHTYRNTLYAGDTAKKHTHTMNWNAALYNTHRQQVVDDNLLNTNVTPPSEKHAWRHSSMHTLEARWTRKIVATLLTTSTIKPLWQSPSPLPSGTWNDQCLAVESFWQRSWKHKNKSSWQLDYIMTLGALSEAERVALWAREMMDGSTWRSKNVLNIGLAGFFLINIKNNVKECVKLKKKSIGS